jgi:uncharacterized protein (TIGR03435 family)
MMNDKAAIRGHLETAGTDRRKAVGQIGGPVKDATGLTGKYDFTLYWSAPPAAPFRRRGRARMACRPTRIQGLR